MTTIILSLLGISFLILASEILWQFKILQAEVARKIIHILVGCVISLWPHFISYDAIKLLSIALLIGIFLSRQFNIFSSIHAVKRSTVGEFVYPISIGLCAVLAPAPWIFTAAILHLSIADGLAAIIGTKTNGWTSYRVFGHKKSLIGSGVFFIVSLAIISVSYAVFTQQELIGIAPLAILAISGVATFVENISWYGLDNLTVPLTLVVALSLV